MDTREAELLQHSQKLQQQEHQLKSSQNQLNIQRSEISALIQECDEKMIKIENDNNLILYKKLELSGIHREVLSNKATSIRSAQHSQQQQQQQLYTISNNNNNNNNNILYTNQSSFSPTSKHGNHKSGQRLLLKPVRPTTSTTAHSNNNNNMNNMNNMVRRSWSGPLPVPAHIANTMQRWNQVDKENDLRAAYATAGINAAAGNTTTAAAAYNAAQGRPPSSSSSMYMESSNTAQEAATPRPEDNNDDDNYDNNNIRQQKPIAASARTGTPFFMAVHIYQCIHIAFS